jgi:transposase
MSQNLNSIVAVIGIDIGKNSFHVVGFDDRGAMVLRQKWSRGQRSTAGQHAAVPDRQRVFGAQHGSRVVWVVQERSLRRHSDADVITGQTSLAN